MLLSSISTLRDGRLVLRSRRRRRLEGGLLRVRYIIEIKDRILRSAPQERVSKDAKLH
jgi:hypothetical protein